MTLSERLRAILGYALPAGIEVQSGAGSEAPDVVFADMDYEIGDGPCGLHERARNADEPAIVYVRADRIADHIASFEADLVTMTENRDGWERDCKDASAERDEWKRLAKVAKADLAAIRAENTRLRAALAMSDRACTYCSLPADEWGKCEHGFPGCARSDDASGCPELGAAFELEAARAEIARLREALAEEREENLWHAYNTGNELAGEWSHLFMSDGEWLVAQCGMDPKQGKYDAEAIKAAIPIAARAEIARLKEAMAKNETVPTIAGGSGTSHG